MATGRHPLLSPPRRLLAAAHGKAQVERQPGETVARVLPTDDPLWGVHVANTGAVDVSASWQEWGDAAEPTSSVASVTSVNVPRGTTSLPRAEPRLR